MTVAITASIAQLLSALSRALQHVQLRRSIGRTAPVVITVQNNIRRPRRFQRPRQRPSEYHAGYKPLFEKEARPTMVSAENPFHTLQSAWVGDRRAARIAGSSPARAPMRIAAPSPPAHASGGMTIAQCLAFA